MGGMCYSELPLQRACAAPAARPAAQGTLCLLCDLVCFGLLIKHGLRFVGGASQSGAVELTPPPRLLFIPSTGVQAAQSRSKASKASPGTHTQLEAQSQGDFKTAGRNSTQIKSPLISAFFPPSVPLNKESVCRRLPLLPPV